MRRQNTPILIIYVIYMAALAMTTALLVFWVLVVQRFTVEINELVSKVGVEWNYFHWFIGSTGAGLFFLVSIALTYLLAITLSERRYRVKQEHFLSNMTHELKSPLAAIKLHAQTLEQGGLEPEEVSLFSGHIVKESERVCKLVENLLESGRLASGKGAGELRKIDLRHFFQEYQKGVPARFDLRQIDLDFEVQTRSVVMATHETLQRIMDNLIDNALRFTKSGGKIRCSGQPRQRRNRGRRHRHRHSEDRADQSLRTLSSPPKGSGATAQGQRPWLSHRPRIGRRDAGSYPCHFR